MIAINKSVGWIISSNFSNH